MIHPVDIHSPDTLLIHFEKGETGVIDREKTINRACLAKHCPQEVIKKSIMGNDGHMIIGVRVSFD
jgi:hypothetical protein